MTDHHGTTVDNVTHSFGALPSDLTNPDGTFMSGSGIPTDHFAMTVDHTTGVTLGIEIGPRQSAAMYTPTQTGAIITTATQVQDSIVDNYALPSGTESTAHGSPVNNTAREATSTMLVVGGPTAALIAEGYKFELTYTSSQNGVFEDALLNTSGQWIAKPQHGHDILDNGPFAENSEQGIFFGGHVPAPGSVADITLSEISPTGVVIMSEHAHLVFGA